MQFCKIRSVKIFKHVSSQQRLFPFKRWVLTRAPLTPQLDSAESTPRLGPCDKGLVGSALTLSDQPASCPRAPSPPNHVRPPLQRPSPAPPSQPLLSRWGASGGASPNRKSARPPAPAEVLSPHLVPRPTSPVLWDTCVFARPRGLQHMLPAFPASLGLESPSSRTRSSDNHKVGQKAPSSAPSCPAYQLLHGSKNSHLAAVRRTEQDRAQ